MTPAFTARRRAEEFNSLVESTGELTDARYVDALELVEALRSVPPVEARPAFVADLRGRLMAAAEAELTPDPDAEVRARLTVTPRRTPRERRLAVALGGFALVGATTSMAMAAQTALPGDTLYPLKRAIENARAGVQVDETDRGSALLANASGRLDEIEALTQDGAADADAGAVADTLQAFTEQAGAASDALIAAYESSGQESSIAELRGFTADSVAELEGLEGAIPEEARGALVQAVQVLGQIEEQVRYVCPTCVPDAARLPPSATDAVTGLVELLAGPTAPPVTDPPAGTRAGGAEGGTGDSGEGDGPGVDAPPGPATGGGTTPPAPSQAPPAPAPSAAPSAGPQGGGGGGSDPLGQLTESLKDGANQPPPTSVPELLEDLDGVIGGVTGPLFP